LREGCVVMKTWLCDAIVKASLSLSPCVQAYPEITSFPPKGKYNWNLITRKCKH